MLGDLWAFATADAVAGSVRWRQLEAADVVGALPPPRWGHAAYASGEGELVLVGGTGADGAPFTDGAWRMGAGCAGDVTLTAARGQLTDGAAGAPPAGRACRWLLRPAAAHTRVRLTLATLALDAGATLSVYDAPSFAAAATAPPLAAALGAPHLSRWESGPLALPWPHRPASKPRPKVKTPHPPPPPDTSPRPRASCSSSRCLRPPPPPAR